MNIKKLCIEEYCFNVEVARTFAEKARGLANRKNLGENTGMLFVFAFEWIYPFTMRGALIPLDIVWFNKNFEIIHISRDRKPCKGFFCGIIMPFKMAKYVLEVNAGTAERCNFKIGDKAILS